MGVARERADPMDNTIIKLRKVGDDMEVEDPRSNAM